MPKTFMTLLLTACILLTARETYTMNFDWQFKKGDYPGAEKVDFDDKDWRRVQVPHDWSIEGPFDRKNETAPAEENFTKWVVWVKGGANGYLPSGIGWYRKKFANPADFGDKKVFLEFEGVYRNATIWLNGKLMNKWVDVEAIKNPILDNPQNVKDDFQDSVKKAKEGAKNGAARMYNSADYDTEKNWISGYVPFMIDVTDHLKKDGENTLVVRCDARLREGWWYEGAGIYRDVRLLVTDQVHVSKWGTYVTTPDITAEFAKVNMETSINNDDSKAVQAELETILMNQDGEVVANAKKSVQLSPGTKKAFDQVMQVANPTLWDIENPYMYKALTKISVADQLVDTYETPFGIRTFHFDPTLGFFLNSKWYRLDGVCNHDCEAAVGMAMTPRLHYEGIKFLREAKGKFYRAAHNPRTNTELDACDKYGVIMANETRYFDNTDFAKKMCAEFMKYLRNHPSIMMWSLGNEEEKVQGQPRGVKIANDLIKVVREMDPTRAVSIAQNRKVNWPGGFSDMFDVLGCNWRGADDMAEDHEKYPQRAVYVSEYNYAGETWHSFAKNRNIAGSSMWTGFDYRGEGSYPGVWWPGWIGDNLHYPAKNFGLAQCQWSDEPAISFYENKWGGKEGEHIKIRAYSNCDEVIAFIGDKEVKRIKMPNRPKRKTAVFSTEEVQFDFDVKFQPGKTVRVIGKKAHYQDVSAELKPLGKAERIHLEASSPTLKNDGQDISIVKISLLDALGNLIRRGEDKQQLAKEIKLTVSGAGYLMATANTAKKGDMPGVASSLAGGNPWTHNGYCQAIIRSNGELGEIKIIAETVDGSMKPHTIVVNATADADPTRVEGVSSAKAVKFAKTAKGGFILGELKLPAKNIKADTSTSFDLIVDNVNSFYPLEVALYHNGKESGVEKFSIELGGKRIVKVSGPRLYKGGKHSLKIIFSSNGHEIKTVNKVLNVSETPAGFKVDTKSIPASVFAGEEFSFTAAVRNTGSVACDGASVPLSFAGIKQTGPQVDLQAGESKELKFTIKVPTSSLAKEVYVLKLGATTQEIKVIDPKVNGNDFIQHGNLSQVPGMKGSKALRFDGTSTTLELKKPLDLKDKLFTICVWFKHDGEPGEWQSDMGLISGEKDGFRAGIKRNHDPFFAFGKHQKWRHPKPKKGEWVMHTYQLNPTFPKKEHILEMLNPFAMTYGFF